MALPSLTRENFTGSLMLNWQTARVDQYISELYPKIVRDCIGAGAYADVVATTQTKWTDIFMGGAYIRESDGKPVWNEGLYSAVRYFIWSTFVGDNFVPTNNGMVVQSNENSNVLALQSNARLVQQRYNEGVLTMQSVASFVHNFANFVQAIDAVVSNGGNSYTIETTATKYLANGDTVAIGGSEFVVSNVVAGVSFDIESTSLPTATSYNSSPFSLVVLGNLRAMV